MREIRRKDRAISADECLAILQKGVYGVLSTVGEDGQPYGVPLSYTVMNEYIYFHCALEGQKVDNISHEPRVSFAVSGEAQAVFSGNFTTSYESVIVFGKAQRVNDDGEKRAALFSLVAKYLPEHLDKAEGFITNALNATAIYAISMDRVTGKAKRI